MKLKDLLIKESDDKFNYMMLSRLQQDNDYFLGNGNGSEKNLWAGNVADQIEEMKSLFKKVEAPEWLSMKDINTYEEKMLKKLKEL